MGLLLDQMYPRAHAFLTHPRSPGGDTVPENRQNIKYFSEFDYIYAVNAYKIRHRCWTSVLNFVEIGLAFFSRNHNITATRSLHTHF